MSLVEDDRVAKRDRPGFVRFGNHEVEDPLGAPTVLRVPCEQRVPVPPMLERFRPARHGPRSSMGAGILEAIAHPLALPLQVVAMKLLIPGLPAFRIRPSRDRR